MQRRQHVETRLSQVHLAAKEHLVLGIELAGQSDAGVFGRLRVSVPFDDRSLQSLGNHLVPGSPLVEAGELPATEQHEGDGDRDDHDVEGNPGRLTGEGRHPTIRRRRHRPCGDDRRRL